MKPTRETAKRYLSQIADLETRAYICRAEVQHRREISTTLPPGSLPPNKYAAKLQAVTRRRDAILAQVAQLENSTLRRYLQAYYAERKSQQQIADDLFFSIDRSQHLHGLALDAFYSQFLKPADDQPSPAL